MKVIGYVLGAILFVTFIVGMVWIGKRVSYGFWYEDMVLETVKESVKQECLK